MWQVIVYPSEIFTAVICSIITVFNKISAEAAGWAEDQVEDPLLISRLKDMEAPQGLTHRLRLPSRMLTGMQRGSGKVGRQKWCCMTSFLVEKLVVTSPQRRKARDLERFLEHRNHRIIPTWKGP